MLQVLQVMSLKVNCHRERIEASSSSSTATLKIVYTSILVVSNSPFRACGFMFNNDLNTRPIKCRH